MEPTAVFLLIIIALIVIGAFTWLLVTVSFIEDDIKLIKEALDIDDLDIEEEE